MHALGLAAVAALLGGASAVAQVPPQDALDARRAQAARRLVRLGADLRRAIQASNVDALVAYVPQDGLRCGGGVVPRARVERDLRTPRTWVHRTLFGAGGARAGAPASLKEFLDRAGEDVAVVVTFEEDAAAGPLGRGCIAYHAKGLSPPFLPLCFFERRGAFWLTESPYPCG